MYQTDLTEIEWQYTTKVNRQTRKGKYDLRMIGVAIFFDKDWLSVAVCFTKNFQNGNPFTTIIKSGLLWISPICCLNDRVEEFKLSVVSFRNSALAFIDSQSIKWGNNRTLNDIDDNKKVIGIKRHIVIDKTGFLLR